MTPGPSPRAGTAEGGRNMAEAKEEGPGPRGRVSGGRGGRGRARDAEAEARPRRGSRGHRAPQAARPQASSASPLASGPFSFLSPRAVSMHHRHERLGIT